MVLYLRMLELIEAVELELSASVGSSGPGSSFRRQRL